MPLPARDDLGRPDSLLHQLTDSLADVRVSVTAERRDRISGMSQMESGSQVKHKAAAQQINALATKVNSLELVISRLQSVVSSQTLPQQDGGEYAALRQEMHAMQARIHELETGANPVHSRALSPPKFSGESGMTQHTLDHFLQQSKDFMDEVEVQMRHIKDTQKNDRARADQQAVALSESIERGMNEAFSGHAHILEELRRVFLCEASLHPMSTTATKAREVCDAVGVAVAGQVERAMGAFRQEIESTVVEETQQLFSVSVDNLKGAVAAEIQGMGAQLGAYDDVTAGLSAKFSALEGKLERELTGVSGKLNESHEILEKRFTENYMMVDNFMTQFDDSLRHLDEVKATEESIREKVSTAEKLLSERLVEVERAVVGRCEETAEACSVTKETLIQETQSILDTFKAEMQSDVQALVVEQEHTRADADRLNILDGKVDRELTEVSAKINSQHNVVVELDKRFSESYQRVDVFLQHLDDTVRGIESTVYQSGGGGGVASANTSNSSFRVPPPRASSPESPGSPKASSDTMRKYCDRRFNEQNERIRDAEEASRKHVESRLDDRFASVSQLAQTVSSLQHQHDDAVASLRRSIENSDSRSELIRTEQTAAVDRLQDSLDHQKSYLEKHLSTSLEHQKHSIEQQIHALEAEQQLRSDGSERLHQQFTSSLDLLKQSFEQKQATSVAQQKQQVETQLASNTATVKQQIEQSVQGTLDLFKQQTESSTAMAMSQQKQQLEGQVVSAGAQHKQYVDSALAQQKQTYDEKLDATRSDVRKETTDDVASRLAQFKEKLDEGTQHVVSQQTTQLQTQLQGQIDRVASDLEVQADLRKHSQDHTAAQLEEVNGRVAEIEDIMLKQQFESVVDDLRSTVEDIEQAMLQQAADQPGQDSSLQEVREQVRELEEVVLKLHQDTDVSMIASIQDEISNTVEELEERCLAHDAALQELSNNQLSNNLHSGDGDGGNVESIQMLASIQEEISRTVDEMKEEMRALPLAVEEQLKEQEMALGSAIGEVNQRLDEAEELLVSGVHQDQSDKMGRSALGQEAEKQMRQRVLALEQRTGTYDEVIRNLQKSVGDFADDLETRAEETDANLANVAKVAEHHAGRLAAVEESIQLLDNINAVTDTHDERLNGVEQALHLQAEEIDRVTQTTAGLSRTPLTPRITKLVSEATSPLQPTSPGPASPWRRSLKGKVQEMITAAEKAPRLFSTERSFSRPEGGSPHVQSLRASSVRFEQLLRPESPLHPGKSTASEPASPTLSLSARIAAKKAQATSPASPASPHSPLPARLGSGSPTSLKQKIAEMRASGESPKLRPTESRLSQKQFQSPKKDTTGTTFGSPLSAPASPTSLRIRLAQAKEQRTPTRPSNLSPLSNRHGAVSPTSSLSSRLSALKGKTGSPPDVIRPARITESSSFGIPNLQGRLEALELAEDTRRKADTDLQMSLSKVEEVVRLVGEEVGRPGENMADKVYNLDEDIRELRMLVGAEGEGVVRGLERRLALLEEWQGEMRYRPSVRAGSPLSARLNAATTTTTTTSRPRAQLTAVVPPLQVHRIRSLSPVRQASPYSSPRLMESPMVSPRLRPNGPSHTSHSYQHQHQHLNASSVLAATPTALLSSRLSVAGTLPPYHSYLASPYSPVDDVTQGLFD